MESKSKIKVFSQQVLCFLNASYKMLWTRKENKQNLSAHLTDLETEIEGLKTPDGKMMSVKLASYSYSFSASSYELPQNVYIGRSDHAEHEYDIRFALWQTV